MKNNIIETCILACGITLAGMFIYFGINHFADKDRAVSVKGLSVRDVKADYVVWPLSFSVQGDALPSTYEEVNKTIATVREFLVSKGFSETDLKQGNTSVKDNWNDYYTRRPDYHYTISTSIVISTQNVDLVVNNQGCQSELLSRGIIINSSDWSVDYQFNGLSNLKPSMIEEATKNARLVAQKFADDAACSLGSIRNASQGQFSIDDDQYQPWMKHVRVVTTVDYYLR